MLTNARIVDPDAQTVRTGTIVLRGDTIAAVRDNIPETLRGTLLDLNGRWVIPGLHDMPVHAGNLGTGPRSMEYFGSVGTARRMLVAGVTAITHTPPGPVPDSVVTAMQKRGTVWIPTLAVHTGMAHWTENPNAIVDSLHAAVVGDDILQSYRDTSAYSERIIHRGQLVDRSAMLNSLTSG